METALIDLPLTIYYPLFLARNLSLFFSRSKQPHQFCERVVELVNDALLERDDCVVGDPNIFRAHARAAFRDVAEADSMRIFQIFQAVFGVKRIHL